MAHKLGGVHAGVPLRINATAPRFGAKYCRVRCDLLSPKSAR
jgi:hypothetical protein